MAEEIKIPKDKQRIYKKTDNREHRSNMEMISLGGLAIEEDGKVRESKMFEFLKLDPDEYNDIMLTKEEAIKVHRRLLGVKWGGAAAKIPLMCGGASICPFSDQCPLVPINKAPVGRYCPIETELVSWWVARYMQEFDVDMENQSEVSLITEMAELDIMDYRCSMLLSKAENAELTQDIVVGVDAQGNPISNEEIHKAFDIKERVKKRKQAILESLVGTRKEQYKRDAALKKRSQEDPSTIAADLKKKMDEARDALADLAKPIDADFTEVPPEE